jgi:hypothetical protein
MRKEQILCWSLLLLIVGGGIGLNNYFVNHKAICFGEMDDHIQYIFKTNLLNHDYIFSEDCFQVIVHKGMDIQLYRVLTIDDNTLENLIFRPGEGYDIKGRGYKNDRYFTSYTDLSLPQIDAYVEKIISDLDLMDILDSDDAIDICLDKKMLEDFNYEYDPEYAGKTYIEGSEQVKPRLIESDCLITKGAVRFVVRKRIYEGGKLVDVQYLYNVYKYF